VPAGRFAEIGGNAVSADASGNAGLAEVIDFLKPTVRAYKNTGRTRALHGLSVGASD